MRAHRSHGGDERARIVALADDDRVLRATAGEVGRCVPLEAVALDGVDHRLRGVGGGHERALVGRGLVAGLVPDLGVDRPGQHELHLDAGAVEVDGHPLGPPAQRELARAVRSLVGDRHTTTEARHVDDAAGAAREPVGEQRQRHAHRRVEVDVHHVRDVGRGEVRHRDARGDAGVVHQAVDAAPLARSLVHELLGGVEVTEVDGPRARLRRVHATLREHLLEPVGAPRHQPDGRAPRRQHRAERGPDARRRAGDDDVGSLDLQRSTLARSRSLRPTVSVAQP